MVFGSNYYHLPAMAFAKIFHGCRTWYDEREMYELGSQGDISFFQKTFLQIWYKLFLPFVDVITTVDSNGGEWVMRYEAAGIHSEVIFNVPVAESVDKRRIQKNIDERDISEEIELVMVGGIKANQGIELLLDALQGIERNFILNLIGVAEPEYIKTITKHAPRNCKIKFSPFLAYAQLIEKISTFHIGLMLKEPNVGQYGHIGIGNSRKPFTYMHAGLPSIGPSWGMMCAQLEQEKAGRRIDVASVKELQTALVDIISHSERYLEYANNGISALYTKYAWEIESQKIIRLLGWLRDESDNARC